MRKSIIAVGLLLFLIMLGAGRKAEPIPAKSGELDINEFVDYEPMYIANEIGVCSTSSTKTYEDYRAITSRSSAQYKFIHEYMTIDEETGFLYDEDGFIGVALGSYYGEIGDRYYITLEGGNVLPVVKIDEKADGDTIKGCAHNSDSSVIEFVIDSDYAAEGLGESGNGLIASGNYNNLEIFEGKIKKFEEVTDERNENYVDYVEKAVEEFDNTNIFQYASGY